MLLLTNGEDYRGKVLLLLVLPLDAVLQQLLDWVYKNINHF